MNDLLNRLKQNKAFKLVIVLIVVFFSFLIYFNQPKAATCQCSNWINCTWDTDPYGAQSNKRCDCGDTAYQECLDNDGEEPVCGTGEYVCNRASGCCPIQIPTPAPTADAGQGSCTVVSWSACTETCGGGVKFSNCGTQKNCNTQACCTPGCGSACGDTSAAPNQVTGIRVNGSILGNLNLTSSANLSITWNDPGTSDPFGEAVITHYTVQVWNKETQPSTIAPYPCNATNDCTEYNTSGKVENYTIAASLDHDNDIYVAVRAINNTCVAVGYGTPSAPSSYDLVASVGGNFYEDQNETPDAFNNCSSASTTAVDLSSYAGTTIATNIGGTPGSIGTSYLITDVPYAPTSSWVDYGFNIVLDIDNSSDPANTLSCTCPTGPCSHTDTGSGYIPGSGPSPNQHIYLSTINLSNGPWWQAFGGNIYGASSLITTIPDACEESAACEAYVVAENLDGDTNSAGIPITGASEINSGGYYTQRGASQPRAVDSDHNNLIRENYAYFIREVNLAIVDTVSGTITSLPSGATPDDDNTEIYYSSGDLTIDISATETIISSRKVVVFVNGNLTFTSSPNTETISVDEGGFIGFIASGNITFEANLGNSSATDTASNIDGVFIADGSINIDGYSSDAEKDNKFVGEGTFVGWSGFDLNRDYDNTTDPLQKALNSENPIEVFIFRPDFNLNIPSIMKRPSLVWQEVN